MNPRGVLYFAGFVEVQDKIRCENLSGVVAHHNGAPGAFARSLQITLVAAGVGCEQTLERERRRVEVQMHATVVDKRGFVQVNVQSVRAFHL